MKSKNKKIALAMSGGVDSSVAAFLLKKQGYEVIGIFMDLGIGDKKSWVSAKHTAKHLGIGISKADIKNEFKKEVIDYFINSYKNGITPNPCVRCNDLIKFGALLKVAKSQGAGLLATGHYARIRKIKSGKNEISGLYKAADKNKDQSYFLYMLGQEQLKRLVFPLGNMAKDDVRKIAELNSIPFIKKESQDVCFLSDHGKIIPHNELLKKKIKMKSGPIISTDGKEVGAHQGLSLYTIGQRRGIEIGGIGPFYVCGFDRKKNILFVTDRYDDKILYGKTLKVKNFNWVSGSTPPLPLDVEAVIRYRHKAVKCKVYNEKKYIYNVEFITSQRAITPGQSIVLYKGKQVLGGGTIK